VRETEEALWICFDKPVEKLQNEKLDPASGLLVMKNSVLEMKKVG